MDSKLETARWAAGWGDRQGERVRAALWGAQDSRGVLQTRSQEKEEEGRKNIPVRLQGRELYSDGAGPSLRVQATSLRRLGRGQASAVHHLKGLAAGHTPWWVLSRHPQPPQGNRRHRVCSTDEETEARKWYMNLPKAPPEYLQNWGSNLGAWVSRASPPLWRKQSEKQVKFGWPRARDRKTKLKFLLSIGKW